MTGKVNGFTLIELLVVLLLISLLASLAAPSTVRSIDKARESALKKDLAVFRQAIDDYYADHGGYPEGLMTLKDARYLRVIPPDPISEDSEWETVPAPNGEGITDVRSQSQRIGSNEKPYSNW
ncbi:prepilin-type N-terminal cleavage/methylation domain-containing protein [Thiohalomonas denitrificans]|uniref:prepilin-type N-terminal cleavage/methylation domain-containing protein n=1 Tax=Thiohalomonas denitrificans TaxID=415747 RepID=UPI0026EACBA1|nr:prepilin-type N-terminal cleavage/methylation domain-containing protein [Thiohalomonas denitrificans]